jgi:hypothetical protein
MCLPLDNDQPKPSASGARSMLGAGALMLLACLAGPVIAGAISGSGVGVLVGAGGAIAAVAVCAAVPAAMLLWRGRAGRRDTNGELVGGRHGS